MVFRTWFPLRQSSANQRRSTSAAAGSSLFDRRSAASASSMSGYTLNTLSIRVSRNTLSTVGESPARTSLRAGARFFIYFCGLPHYVVTVGGGGLKTDVDLVYAGVMFLLLAIALFFVFIGGQIAAYASVDSLHHRA